MISKKQVPEYTKQFNVSQMMNIPNSQHLHLEHFIPQNRKKCSIVLLIIQISMVKRQIIYVQNPILKCLLAAAKKNM